MRRFWSDAFRVRSVKNFQARTVPYKLMDLGYVLTPVAVTLSAHIGTNTRPRLLASFWSFWFLAGFLWLSLILQAANYLRGYLALRRGVQPAPPGPKPDIQIQKRVIVGMAAVLTLMILVPLIPFSNQKGRDREDWSSVLFFSALILMQLPSYAQNRFWNAAAS